MNLTDYVDQYLVAVPSLLEKISTTAVSVVYLLIATIYLGFRTEHHLEKNKACAERQKQINLCPEVGKQITTI